MEWVKVHQKRLWSVQLFSSTEKKKSFLVSGGSNLIANLFEFINGSKLELELSTLTTYFHRLNNSCFFFARWHSIHSNIFVHIWYLHMNIFFFLSRRIFDEITVAFLFCHNMIFNAKYSCGSVCECVNSISIFRGILSLAEFLSLVVDICGAERMGANVFISLKLLLKWQGTLLRITKWTALLDRIAK